MIILGCDPGTTKSALVWLDNGKVTNSLETPNEDVLDVLSRMTYEAFAFEQIEAMGMAVGREVFETVFWSGRFAEASLVPYYRITRRQVKLHLCGSMKAKDANIRQALIDKFGGATAVGRKAAPGPLYGIASHRWSALAVAVTCRDTSDFKTGGER